MKMNNSKFNKLKKYFVDFIFAVSLLFFIIASNFQDGRFKGWELQFLSVGNQINDVKFLDSLTGFAVTNLNSNISYILKTTNAGNNWNINKTNTNPFTRIGFLNKNVGYCASWDTLFKTTNSGDNWNPIPVGNFGFWISDMHILNEDTMWVAWGEGLTGGIFRTTDGGQNWIQQFYQYNNNPDKIYMVNKNLGFMSRDQSYTGRTTNGGFNWSITIEDSTFRYIVFVDSLIGYSSFVGVKKTTNGGLNWFSQRLPTVIGSIFNDKAMLKCSVVNKDTVYGVGAMFVYPNNQGRCLVYKTTNGGINWGYQIPDTGFQIYQLFNISFIDNLKGWVFRISTFDLHTTLGGDTTIFTSINNNTTIINPTSFKLEQNYPNPYNSSTLIGYYLQEPGWVKIKLYDIAGKEIATLVNEVQGTGGYGIPVSLDIPSGIYFYRMVFIPRNGEVQADVKKLVIVK
jgi:hypothetical protein